MSDENPPWPSQPLDHCCPLAGGGGSLEEDELTTVVILFYPGIIQSGVVGGEVCGHLAGADVVTTENDHMTGDWGGGVEEGGEGVDHTSLDGGIVNRGGPGG